MVACDVHGHVFAYTLVWKVKNKWDWICFTLEILQSLQSIWIAIVSYQMIISTEDLGDILMNFAALLGLNELDDVLGQFLIKYFYPYDNLMKVKQKSHVVAKCQEYGNLFANSVIFALVTVIIIAHNSIGYDNFLKSWFAGLVLLSLLSGATVFQVMAKKLGSKTHELIRFEKVD